MLKVSLSICLYSVGSVFLKSSDCCYEDCDDCDGFGVNLEDMAWVTEEERAAESEWRVGSAVMVVLRSLRR